MVKISFQPAVAGIKADKADKASASASAPAPGPAAEILLTPTREERPPYHRHKKGGSVGSVCYLSMGMVVLLMGLVFASVYIYRYFFLAQLARDNFFHCGIFYEDSLSSQARTRMELEEDVKIYLEDNYERINVPVPQFGGGDPADIIHDFQRGLTAYHDISLDKCYVIELNTTIVLPPRSFWELLMNVKRGTYLPQTYIIQEEMVVTEHVSDKETLGSFIYHLELGGGRSLSSTIVLRIEPKREEPGPPAPPPGGAAWAAATGTRGGPRRVASHSALWAERSTDPRRAVGLAEGWGLPASSELPAVLEDPAERRERHLVPAPPASLFCSPPPPPPPWGDAPFSFSCSLLHVFTDRSIC
uniref:Integral membrane protein 2 n=1 Tax=Molossus molossus TaxID=27622 RepID=A0A7J8FRN5_MOLMO|nr:integral membrane protein 2C [Molossus molossus]